MRLVGRQRGLSHHWSLAGATPVVERKLRGLQLLSLRRKYRVVRAHEGCV